MNTNKYLFWPIRFMWVWRPHFRAWRVGIGPKHEAGWIGRQGTIGSRMLLAWTLSLGPLLIAFGRGK